MINKYIALNILIIFMLAGETPVLADDVSVTTYYPAPYGVYKYVQIDDSSSSFLDDATTSLAGNGLGITTTYEAGVYTPGVFWASENDNAGIPKAGIWTWNGSRGTGRVDVDNIPYVWPGDTDGSHLLFGTSGNPGTGIDQTRMVLSPKGYLGIGIDPSAATAYEPQSRLWVDNGFVSVQNGPAWSSAQWPISYTSGQSAAMTIAGPHELDATATAMGVGDGYLGFGITSDSAAAPEGSKNAGWYFIRAQDKFGVTTNAPEYPVVFKGGAPASSLYVSEEGNVFMGPANLTIPAPSTGVTVTSPANNQATQNLQVNDVYLRSIGQWATEPSGNPNPGFRMKVSRFSASSFPIPFNPPQYSAIGFDTLVFTTVPGTTIADAGKPFLSAYPAVVRAHFTVTLPSAAKGTILTAHYQGSGGRTGQQVTGVATNDGQTIRVSGWGIFRLANAMTAIPFLIKVKLDRYPYTSKPPGLVDATLTYYEIME